jgi:hypothetical protein
MFLTAPELRIDELLSALIGDSGRMLLVHPSKEIPSNASHGRGEEFFWATALVADFFASD